MKKTIILVVPPSVSVFYEDDEVWEGGKVELVAGAGCIIVSGLLGRPGFLCTQYSAVQLGCSTECSALLCVVTVTSW